MAQRRVFTKNARLTGALREEVTEEVKRSYGEGKSIRKIADETGRSYGSVHRLLQDAGVKLRKRGGDRRRDRHRAE